MARTNRKKSYAPTGKLSAREPRPRARRMGTRAALVRRAVREG